MYVIFWLFIYYISYSSIVYIAKFYSFHVLPAQDTAMPPLQQSYVGMD